MCYDKPFKDLDEQVNLLKERKLIIQNTDTAKHFLLTASYYDLVNGYKDVCMPNNIFIKDTSIEELFVLNYIDKNVQSILMKYSLMVEVKFKTCLSYILSKNIGVHQDDYLHQTYFKEKANRNLSFQDIKAEISKQLDKNKAKQPTKHYLNNHNHVPPWILMKNISLGSAINLFKCLNSNNKKEFIELFLPSPQLSSKERINLITVSMDNIRKFRNCAAHNLNFVKCRGISGRFPGELIYKLLPKGVVRKYKQVIAKNDRRMLDGLFGVILSLCLFLNDSLLCLNLLKEFTTALSNSNNKLCKYYEIYRTISTIPQDVDKRLNNLEKVIPSF